MYDIRSKTAKTTALAALILGLGAITAPATAHDDHYYGHRYWQNHGHHGVRGYAWRRAYPRGFHRYHWVDAPCHPVVGYGHDHFGRRAEFGGTMCYDRFGRGYVVPGSRYLIRYF